MYSFDDNHEVLQCPYNKHHTVPRSKFQRHLVKCEKNYPPDYKVICPYNATHRLSKSEIEEHINTCPRRNIVEASYIQPPSTHDMMKMEECKSTTSEIGSDIFWDSQEEMNLPKIPLNSKLRDQLNGSIEENFESFVSTVNNGRDLTRRYEYLSDESSIRDDMESIVTSIGQDRMFSNAKYHRRFKMREEKK